MKRKLTNKTHSYFFVSPYVFSLSSFGIIAMSFMMLQCCYFLSVSGSDPQTYLVLALAVAGVVVGFLWDAHELLGVIKFSESEFIVMAPFRKALRFPYSEICDIGIDYGSLSVGIQFWIYIGKEKIPQKYCHRINRLPFSKEYVRIQYSEKVFAALHERIPESKKKQFYNSQTVLRVNKQ